MATLNLLDEETAAEIINKLRNGTPSTRYASYYSAGNSDFLESVQKRHLRKSPRAGRIRFVSGSWGSGKTHFLRLVREKAFESGFLVSTVELSADEAPFNKFEEVFRQIVRNITSPEMYADDDLYRSDPFGEVLKRIMLKGIPGPIESVPYDVLNDVVQNVMSENSIDIDFRRIVTNYLKTYIPDGSDQATLEETRGHLMQWFAGEGTIGDFRSKYGVQKMVNRSNARTMLTGLSRFTVNVGGYSGLLVLLDEAEHTYSTMRRSSLKQAHNNLLHLINGIDHSQGVFLIYTATPDFFISDVYGIQTYGALAQRIGEPGDHPPKAVDRVWNLDRIETSLDQYQAAACKVREIYMVAEPESQEHVLSEDCLRARVEELVRSNPEFSPVRTWRVVITGTVKLLDFSADGEDAPSAGELYDDVMADLREL